MCGSPCLCFAVQLLAHQLGYSFLRCMDAVRQLEKIYQAVDFPKRVLPVRYHYLRSRKAKAGRR